MSPSTSQASPLPRGERVDRGGERTGVGVVAVVDQHRAVVEAVARSGARRPAARHAGPRRWPRSEAPTPSASAAAASALRTLWRPGSGSAICASPCGVTRMKREPSSVRDVARADVGAGVEAEADQATTVRALGEVRREGIVGVDHRHAVGRQRVVDRAPWCRRRRAGCPCAPGAPGAMLLTSATSGRTIAGQVGDVAGLAGAHLVDGELQRPRGASSTASGRPISLLRLPGLA